MPEYLLQGEEPEIVGGVARVVAGLSKGLVYLAEPVIREALHKKGSYSERPVNPGPQITLTQNGQGEDFYRLKLIGGKLANQTGNVTRAEDLVDMYLKKYYVEGKYQKIQQTHKSFK